jgi:hypothetical protein
MNICDLYCSQCLSFLTVCSKLRIQIIDEIIILYMLWFVLENFVHYVLNLNLSEVRSITET